MIRFENVADIQIAPLSFEVNPGTAFAVVAQSPYECRQLTRMVCGIHEPRQGKVYFEDRDMYAIDEDERLELMRNYGMVWGHGGIINNLKVWENVYLPASYHSLLLPEEAENRVREYYSMVGREDIDTFMASPSGGLTDPDRVLLGTVRAMLMEPHVMIYDNVLDVYGRHEAHLMGEMLMSYHDRDKSRTSLFFCDSIEALEHLQPDGTVHTGRAG